MYRAGIASILSQLHREGRLSVIDALAVDAPKTRLFAQKIKALGLPGTCWSSPTSSTTTCSCRRATWPTCWCSRRAKIDPVSLVRFNNVLLTKGAVAQFEEMLG